MGHWSNWGNGFCNGFSFFGPDYGFLGGILSILIWGLIVYGVVSVFSRLIKKNNRLENDSALEILRRRYASGEISDDEFYEMKIVLSAQ